MATFPIYQIARIRSGKRTIAPIHNNWRPTLNGLVECTCGDDVEYRIVTVRKRAR